MRQPNHARPIAGAVAALGLTAFLFGGTSVVGLRAGDPPEAFVAPAFFLAVGIGFASLLAGLDALVLRLAGRLRPAWARRAWTLVPMAVPAGALAGALTGFFY